MLIRLLLLTDVVPLPREDPDVASVWRRGEVFPESLRRTGALLFSEGSAPTVLVDELRPLAFSATSADPLASPSARAGEVVPASRAHVAATSPICRIERSDPRTSSPRGNSPFR